MAARDGGSWRDEIYGFGQFRGANRRGVYEVLFGRPLSRPPIGRHLFLLIGRCRPGGDATVNMTDGRRWDLGGVGTNERHRKSPPLNHRGCEATSAPTEEQHPFDCESIYLAARTNEILEGGRTALPPFFPSLFVPPSQ